MKFLIMTGPLYPRSGNNANLIVKLIPYFLADRHEHHDEAGYGLAHQKRSKRN